jgi:hypothetical protein
MNPLKVGDHVVLTVEAYDRISKDPQCHTGLAITTSGVVVEISRTWNHRIGVRWPEGQPKMRPYWKGSLQRAETAYIEGNELRLKEAT